MQHGNHLKQMLIVAAFILVGLLAFDVPTGPALATAAVLACPLGMAAMMFFMMRGSHSRGGENAHGPGHEHTQAPASVQAPAGPARH